MQRKRRIRNKMVSEKERKKIKENIRKLFSANNTPDDLKKAFAKHSSLKHNKEKNNGK